MPKGKKPKILPTAPDSPHLAIECPLCHAHFSIGTKGLDTKKLIYCPKCRQAIIVSKA